MVLKNRKLRFFHLSIFQSSIYAMMILHLEQNPQSIDQWGPFDIHSILLCIEKGVGTFKFTGGERPFWNLENVLSPEGTLQSRAQWGPFWSFHFIVSREGCSHFQIYGGWEAFLKSWKCFIYGWMGWDGIRWDGVSKVSFKNLHTL